jgi:hypothetical protein
MTGCQGTYGPNYAHVVKSTWIDWVDGQTLPSYTLSPAVGPELWLHNFGKGTHAFAPWSPAKAT